MKTHQAKMADLYGKIPGVTMAELPPTPFSDGFVLVEPSCAKPARDFLKRRFKVGKEVLIETTGELRFTITPRVITQRDGKRRVTYAVKPIQYELKLPPAYERLTKDEAGKLPDMEACHLLGPWWTGGEGYTHVKTEEGRQIVHRTWLRYTFNNDASPIPTKVLESYATEAPHWNARCWFARELWDRTPEGKAARDEVAKAT